MHTWVFIRYIHYEETVYASWCILEYFDILVTLFWWDSWNIYFQNLISSVPLPVPALFWIPDRFLLFRTHGYFLVFLLEIYQKRYQTKHDSVWKFQGISGVSNMVSSWVWYIFGKFQEGLKTMGFYIGLAQVGGPIWINICSVPCFGAAEDDGMDVAIFWKQKRMP